MAAAMNRRTLLLGATAFAVAKAVHAQPGPKIAAIDWAMLETLMLLGITPVAATELIQFRKDAVEPPIPSGVTDLGLRGSPNFELLHLLKPELILASPFYTRHLAALEAIAPVLSLPFYVRGEPPFEKALVALHRLGERIGRTAQAKTAADSTLAELDRGRSRLAPFAGRPTYLVNVGDARHVRVFGSDSMFGDVLLRLGLPNAWADRSRFTFAAPVPIENLASQPDARIVIVSEIPVEARRGLAGSVIWNSLEPVRSGRVLQLGNINPYGGLTAAMRFARLLGEALPAEGDAG